MAGRPLRPATDRRLGEPLPHQLPNQTQAPLQAHCCFNNCHHAVPLHYAVLASLSTGYSPPEGRLPTRYSPGRHSTQGRSPFRVRLACVRHAASVDSEPGSNSQSIILGNRSDSRTTLILRSLQFRLLKGLDVFSLCLIFKDRSELKSGQLLSG